MNVETQSSLYNRFKEILDKMKNKEKPLVVFSLHELNCDDTKQFFQVTIELISSGINFAIAKQIDKRMWHILKQQIDIELKSISPDVDEEIKQFYDLRINFLKSIIKNLTQQNQLGGLKNDTVIYYQGYSKNNINQQQNQQEYNFQQIYIVMQVNCMSIQVEDQRR